MYSKDNIQLYYKYKNQNYAPTGEDYENYIIKELREIGYKAYGTKKSGDQGADIIINLNEYFRIIAQCKYYSSPVGNTPVQEIIAAKEYYRANYCIAVTNQTFTQGAISLAYVNNVKLIDKFDIGDDIYSFLIRTGLIPQKIVESFQLQINDLKYENKELHVQNQMLKQSIKERCFEDYINSIEIDDTVFL